MDEIIPELPDNTKEIDILKSEIFGLSSKKQSMKIPRRSIAYQFANLRFGGRRIENQNRIMRMKRKGISKEIKGKTAKLNLLMFPNGL